MKKILVICAVHRDYRELQRKEITQDYEIIFDELSSQYTELLEESINSNRSGELINQFSLKNLIEHLKISYGHIDGIISSDDYPGSSLASLLAEFFGLNGPSLQSVLACQHKYYARTVQKDVIPEATPDVAYFDMQTKKLCGILPKFPCIAKPVKSYFSINAQTIHSEEDLENYLFQVTLLPKFYEPFSWLLQEIRLPFHPYSILIEELVHGIQCTLEGFFYNNSMHVVGVVDSLMYPNTICFERFVYPSALSQTIQDRMAVIAKRSMKALNFDNGFFNIEFIYNPLSDTIHLIEINPRMCSQFADLYEKVDGFNTYTLALDLAVGKQPTLIRNQGMFKKAASCVLRLFSDCIVSAMPTQQNIEQLYALFPEIRIDIHASIGKKLSAELQDGKSYRYCVIHLGGSNNEDIINKLKECEKILSFEFIAC